MAKTPSMEDILSSIRSTVQEETTKTIGEGEDITWVDGDDAVEPVENATVALPVEQLSEEIAEGVSAAMAESADAQVSIDENDILNLTAADLVEEEEILTAVAAKPEKAEPETELIDINSFMQQGEDQPVTDKLEQENAVTEGATPEAPAEAETTEATSAAPAEEATPAAAAEKTDEEMGLDPDKSDEEVAAEIDALLAEVQQEEKNNSFPKMGEEPAAEDEPAVTPEEEAAAAAEPALESVDDLMNETDATAVEVPAGPGDDTGPASKEEAVAELLAKGEDAPAEDETVDVDALLAEGAAATPAEEPSPAEEPAAAEAEEDVDIDALMAEAPTAGEAAEAEAMLAETTEEPAVEPEEPAAAPVEEPAPAPEPTPAPPPPAPKQERVNLTAMPSPSGLQVAFPAEVLAEALRPLVHDWVVENLPDLVERLVREELSKLAEE